MSGIPDKCVTNQSFFTKRFKKLKWSLFLYVKHRRIPLRESLPPHPDIHPSGFRWDSLLISKSQVAKRHLQNFIDSHNRNVLAFQALLDYPERINLRIEPFPKPLYLEMIRTDVIYSHATRIVDEIQSNLLNLMTDCREMYVYGQCYKHHGPFLDKSKLFIQPGYNSLALQDMPLFSWNNEWAVTDETWKPREHAIATGQYFRLSSTLWKDRGVMDTREAIILALFNPSRSWNRFKLLSHDECRVTINTQKQVISIQILRWMNSTTEIQLKLNRNFLNYLLTEGPLELHFVLRQRNQSKVDFRSLALNFDRLKRRW